MAMGLRLLLSGLWLPLTLRFWRGVDGGLGCGGRGLLFLFSLLPLYLFEHLRPLVGIRCPRDRGGFGNFNLNTPGNSKYCFNDFRNGINCPSYFVDVIIVKLFLSLLLLSISSIKNFCGCTSHSDSLKNFKRLYSVAYFSKGFILSKMLSSTSIKPYYYH